MSLLLIRIALTLVIFLFLINLLFQHKMSSDRIRIQFPISPANRLQLVKMVDTAMEKISRSFPNPLFHDVVIRQNYPIIETTYPPLEISAYDQIKLEIYLHSHVVDAKIHQYVVELETEIAF